MLNTTRKLCPLLSLLITITGCGKKITEPTPGIMHDTQNQTPSPTVMMEVNSAISKTKTLMTGRDAHVMWPERLQLKTANNSSLVVEMYYNVDPTDDTYYEGVCTYKSISAKELTIKSCVDDAGYDIGLPDSVVIIDGKKEIRMNVKSTVPAPVTVDAALYVSQWL